MSDLSEIRDGLKTVLETHNSKLRVYLYEPDGGVTQRPGLVLGFSELEYHEMAMGGNAIQQDLRATLYLTGGNSVEMEAELDKYRSPTGAESIKAGITTDPTLNSKADTSKVVRSDDVQRNRDGMGPWEYSCVFHFDIIKSIA